MTLEAEIEAAVSDWCEQRNILHAKFSPFGRSGFPDHIYFLPYGKAVLIEYKRPGEEPERLQQHFLGILLELGYDVCVCQTKLEATRYLEQRIKAAYAARLPTARR